MKPGLCVPQKQGGSDTVRHDLSTNKQLEGKETKPLSQALLLLLEADPAGVSWGKKLLFPDFLGLVGLFLFWGVGGWGGLLHVVEHGKF